MKTHHFSLIRITILATSLLLGISAHAAVDMFLEIPGVRGEAPDDEFKDGIEVLAWSWGMSHSGSLGKASFQDLSVTKYVDRSSADLMLHVANASHYPEAVLTVRKAGEKPVKYIKIVMKDVFVTSVSTGGSDGEDKLTENVTFIFNEVRFEYTAQKKDGSAEDSPSIFEWNIGKGQ